MHIDLVRRQPERVGRHLAHDGIRSATDLVHPGLDESRTVAPHRHARLCRPSPVRVDRSGYSLANEVPAIAHRARLGIAFVPTKALRALHEAAAQATRGERTATVRVDG